MNILDISLDSTTGKDFKLSAVTTNYALVYIYPKDMTPGCTLENHDFSNNLNEFDKRDITIIGVSADNLDSHHKFVAKCDLKQMLLADPDKKLIHELGAYGEKNLYGKIISGILRSTYLIDIKSGKVIKEWRNVRATGHVAKILKEIDQYL